MYIDNNNGKQQASDLKSSFPGIFQYFFNSELIDVIVNESNIREEKLYKNFSRPY